MKSCRNTFLVILFILFFCQQGVATEIIFEEDATDGEDIVATTSPAVKEVAGREESIERAFSKEKAEPFEIIGYVVEPGVTRNLRWFATESLLGSHHSIPVIVVNGEEPGPVVVLTAAIHGDELNGIEIVRQIMHEIDPQKLKGTLVGLPVVNLEGFWRKERYIGDRKDLNRYFPGNPQGSYPARIADLLFTNFIEKGDIVIDLHTGSFYRENLPQLRVDLNVPGMSKLATGFGAITALQSVAPAGSLRGAATSAGIPTVVMEVGGPLSLEMDKVETGVKSIRTFLQAVGMINKKTFWPNPQPVFYGSQWLRADAGGILVNKVKLGEAIKEGQVLAEISNPLSNESHSVISPINGTVLGRAQNQFVGPGFALFHIGHKKSVEEIEKEASQTIVEEEGETEAQEKRVETQKDDASSLDVEADEEDIIDG